MTESTKKEKRRTDDARAGDSSLRALLNAVTEALFLLDKDGTVLAANETLARRLNVRVDKIVGVNYYDLLPADVAEERRKQADQVIRNASPVRFEDSRDQRCIDHVIYPVCDEKGRVASLAFVEADITKRREMEKQMEAMALTDQLTGLYNRRGFFTLATRELKRAERTTKGLMLVFADLDGLKEINDRFGHEEGDRALVAGAKILMQCFRSSDIISRIGGDEFAILIIDVSEALMEKLLLRLYRLFNNWNARRKPGLRLTMSIGHAAYDPAKPSTLDELIAYADQRMYRMKKAGYRRV